MSMDETRCRTLEEMLKRRRAVLVRSASATISERRAGAERDELGREGHTDIDFAVAVVRLETVEKIDGTLARLREGIYGNCFECGEEIAEKRLRAIPFAVRCKYCEDAREEADAAERAEAVRRDRSQSQRSSEVR